MKITDLHIIAELERLAEAFPWDSVDIWVTRGPEGKYRFQSYVRDNPKMGSDSIFGSGPTPAEAVNEAIKQAHRHDPEIARRKKIEELKEQIRKLESVIIGLPPYRPGRALTNGEAFIEAPATVDV